MPNEIKSIPGLVNYFESRSPDVQQYFQHLPDLIEGYPLEVSLAYAFSRLELGQNMALYSGVVKLHKTNSEVSRAAVNTHHMTRDDFKRLYKTVFGFELRKSASDALGEAEDTRDSIMHGKRTTNSEIRNALASVLDYAEAMNNQLDQGHGLRPYGSLQGFSGRSKKLGKKISRYALKGMGFSIG